MRAVTTVTRRRPLAGRTAPRDRRESAARGEHVGQPRREHAGVDRADDLVAERDAREDRNAEHVGDLTPGERPTGLVDEHRSDRAGERTARAPPGAA